MKWDEYCDANANTSDWLVPTAVIMVLLGLVVLAVVLL